MAFEFATANRIIFGAGSVRQAGRLAREIGQRALVASGLPGENPLLAGFTGILQQSGLEVSVLTVRSEPTLESIQTGVKLAQETSCDLVIGFGGGSAIDSAKAIAALSANPGDPVDYLEVVGKGRKLLNPPLPVIAIPTTAGTGAEVTRNAVIGVPEQRLKVSLRSPLMLPRLAIVDPELTCGLPPEVTTSTGMDALTQLIEPFLSNQSNPLTDAICREGMARAARSLVKVYNHPGDASGREDMALASLFGGLALANAKLGVVHGFAGVIGGMVAAPHGAICARLLPVVLETNLQALKSREPANPALKRFDEIARLLTGVPESKAEDGIEWLYQLRAELNIPALGSLGVQGADFGPIVAHTINASSTKGNPIQLTEDELNAILEKAI